MTKGEFIRLAHEAGWQYADGDDGYDPLWKFGELVAAAEREACAKLCEALDDGTYAGGDQPYGIHYARAIRARGQE